ncbi:hypothetical protein F4678DRAFT_486060 [Xylaria arbuscula]|nr:hypothetical protein F4678DRAFT_486060 [Xylaria arbuscula]
MAPKAAFITGGNGITGCALLEHLTKTDATEWSKIIVTSRSPFKTVVDDDRVTFIALDFTLDPARLIESMQPVCADVTHAYFSSYVHRDDFQELNKANVDLFDNFLQSLLALTSKLACCLFQTGEPRRESPIGNFYFLVCRELGAEAKMPTNQSYWEGYDGVSDARLIADISIWASTEPHAGNQAINVANGDYFSWRHMWPRPAAYFGAKASSDQVFTQPRPKEGERHQEFRLNRPQSCRQNTGS